MATTANYGWTKPTVGADQDVWGTTLNTDLDSIDSTVFGMLPKAGGTCTGTVTFTAGTTTVAPVKFQAGVVLATPVAHAHEWDGSRLYVTNGSGTRLTLAYSNDTYSGTLTASQVNAALGYTAGYLNIPSNSQTAAYVAAATDIGKCIDITTGGVTINAGVFAKGDAFSIYNDSASSQTITQGTSVTLELVGTTTTGSRTLAAHGMALVRCVGTNRFVVSGVT